MTPAPVSLDHPSCEMSANVGDVTIVSPSTLLAVCDASLVVVRPGRRTSAHALPILDPGSDHRGGGGRRATRQSALDRAPHFRRFATRGRGARWPRSTG